MTEDQILHLWHFVAMGRKVAWAPDDVTFRLVERVAVHPDEPSRCAFFQGGEYAALYNADPAEFFEVAPLFPNTKQPDETRS